MLHPDLGWIQIWDGSRSQYLAEEAYIICRITVCGDLLILPGLYHVIDGVLPEAYRRPTGDAPPDVTSAKEPHRPFD